MKAAVAEANPASDLQNPVRQVHPREQGEQRRHCRNAVSRRSGGWAKRQILVRGLNGIRRRVAAEHLNASGSVRRGLREQAKVSSAAEVRPLDFVNRSPRHLVADPPVKHASREKEPRVLMASRLRHNEEVARLAKLSAAKHRDNRKAERESRRKKLHRPDNSSSDDLKIGRAHV